MPDDLEDLASVIGVLHPQVANVAGSVGLPGRERMAAVSNGNETAIVAEGHVVCRVDVVPFQLGLVELGHDAPRRRRLVQAKDRIRLSSVPTRSRFPFKSMTSGRS